MAEGGGRRTGLIVGVIIVVILVVAGAIALLYRPAAPPKPAAKVYKIEIVKLERPSYDVAFIVLNAYGKLQGDTVIPSPFNDTKIRQALAWATPYSSIWHTIYADLAGPYRGVIPKGMPGYTETGLIKYEYNLTKAQEIIAQTDAYKNNETYTITIYYNLGNDARARIAALLQNSWGQLVNMAGDPIFQISVQALNWPTLLEAIEFGDFDVYIIGWAPDYADPDNYAGPMFYGATVFSELNYQVVQSASEVANLVAPGAEVIETDNYFVVVGEKGTGFTPTQTGKPYLVVSYVVDEVNTPSIVDLMKEGQGFGAINPAFYRNVHADALIVAGREYVFETDLRIAIYQAIQIISNREVPIIWLAQFVPVRTRWTWVQGLYYHPVMFVRYDLVWEETDAPTVSILGGKYQNDYKTFVIGTIGWPRSFDPAASYETFGWNIFYQTGSRLITYWREETTYPTPDVGVAWAFSKDKSTLFFVVRGGVKAYDQWNNKTYDIDASDVLFSIWRVARLRHSVSWMIRAFIDVNASTIMTEDEFDTWLSQNGAYAEFRGKINDDVRSLSDLLSLFGYTGDTAGVVALKLYVPYPAILPILADPFLKILPAEYVLGANYTAAMQATNNGRDPSGYAQYVGNYWKTDWTHKLLHEKPVSTGPYYVKEYKEDAYIVLEKNPYYWNKTLWETVPNGGHDRVIWIIANDWTSRKSLFVTGALDTAYVPAENIPEVNGTTWGGGGLTAYTLSSLPTLPLFGFIALPAIAPAILLRRFLPIS